MWSRVTTWDNGSVAENNIGIPQLGRNSVGTYLKPVSNMPIKRDSLKNPVRLIYYTRSSISPVSGSPFLLTLQQELSAFSLIQRIWNNVLQYISYDIVIKLFNHRAGLRPFISRMKYHRYQRATTMWTYIKLFQFLIHTMHILLKYNAHKHIIMTITIVTTLMVITIMIMIITMTMIMVMIIIRRGTVFFKFVINDKFM